jgi:flagellar motor protein MotB
MTPQSVRRIAIIVALLLNAVPAMSQDLSTADIIEAPKPKPKVRALTLEQDARESRQNEVVDRLQREKTRSLTVEARDEIAEVVAENDLPAIDLELFFASNSDEIEPEALSILEKLGAALNDDALKDSVFLVAGHTDAEEDQDQEPGLSDRRAQAVRDFIVDKFGIEPQRLVAAGFGAERLKNEGDPLAGENRRVQIVNMAK